MDIFNLSEIVRTYGNEKQKQMMIRMNGNLKADSFISVLKTVEQHYEYVDVKGRGSKRVFYCYNKLKKMKERNTKYSNCGSYKEVPYKNALLALVSKYILNRTDNKPITINNWLTRCGAMDNKLYESYKNNNKSINRYFKEIVELKILGEEQRRKLEHYVFYEVSYLQNTLESIFKDLSSNGVIFHEKIEMGCFLSGGEKFKPLSSEQEDDIGLIKEGLRWYHDITPYMTRFYSNSPRVKAYNSNLEKGLLEYNLEYTFQAHNIVLIDENKLTEYCNYGSVEDFKSIHQKYSLSNAQSRQDEFNKRYRIIEEWDIVSKLKEDKEYVNVWEKLQEYYLVKLNKVCL